MSCCKRPDLSINKYVPSLYSLEFRRKIKFFKPVFLKTGTKFFKICNVVGIMTKRALI